MTTAAINVTNISLSKQGSIFKFRATNLSVTASGSLQIQVDTIAYTKYAWPFKDFCETLVSRGYLKKNPKQIWKSVE